MASRSLFVLQQERGDLRVGARADIGLRDEDNTSRGLSVSAVGQVKLSSTEVNMIVIRDL